MQQKTWIKQRNGTHRKDLNRTSRYEKYSQKWQFLFLCLTLGQILQWLEDTAKENI